ncbi:MAG: AsmA family protein [Nitratireductor sp.]
MRKSLRISVLAVLIVVVSSVVALPFLVSSERVRSGIILKAMELTGRQVSIAGKPKISFSPFLGIEVSNIIVEGSGASKQPFAEIEKLRARIALLPLLAGRITLADFNFLRPVVRLSTKEDGQVNWAFPNAPLSRLVAEAQKIRQEAGAGTKPDFSDLTVLQPGNFKISDGVINYENSASGASEKLTNVNATLDWPDTRTAGSLIGDTVWRGEVFKFDLSAANPLHMLAGSASKTSIRVNSAALAFSFTGDANTLAGLHLAGPAKFTTPSINRLAALSGELQGSGSNLGAFSAEGNLNATPTQIQMSDALIVIDGNRCKGIFQIARNEAGRVQTSATLAFSTLDLTPYVGIAEQHERAGENALSVFSLIDDFDADLRISAAKAIIGGFSAGDLAGALSIRNSELSFDIGNAAVLGGGLTGKVGIGIRDGITTITTSGKLAAISLPELQDVLPVPGFTFTGKTDVKFQSKSMGRELAQLPASTEASIELSGANGSIEGADFSQLRKLLTSKGEPRGEPVLAGKSVYSQMSGRIAISGRTAWFRDLTFIGDDTTAGIYGRAQLGSGGLALRARLTPSQGGGERDTYALAFIGGTIKSPLVMRDPAQIQSD